MRWPILLSVLTSLLAVNVPDAHACSCVPPEPPRESYFASDVVFIGTVRRITRDAGAPSEARLRVEFHDVIAYRGAGGTMASVLTDEHTASCGYPFRNGGRYVVYAHKSKETQHVLVSLCSRTGPISHASEDLKFFATLPRPVSPI
jgi:hypothetical protein